MCGICGIYEYKTQRPVNQQILDDMLQVLHHRGPDDAGSFLDRDRSEEHTLNSSHCALSRMPSSA